MRGRILRPHCLGTVMSNFRYRDLGSMEAELRRNRMIADAVSRRYLQRGGAPIDEFVAYYTNVFRMSGQCRTAEAARLEKDAAAMRERGERPLITVSEGRLHGNKLQFYLERKEELMAASREEISTALKRDMPSSEEELRVALDMALGEISEESRKIMARYEEEMKRDHEEMVRTVKPLNDLIRQIPDEIDRERLMEAWRLNDEKTLTEVLSRQSKEWLTAWQALCEQGTTQAASA